MAGIRPKDRADKENERPKTSNGGSSHLVIKVMRSMRSSYEKIPGVTAYLLPYVLPVWSVVKMVIIDSHAYSGHHTDLSFSCNKNGLNYCSSALCPWLGKLKGQIIDTNRASS